MATADVNFCETCVSCPKEGTLRPAYCFNCLHNPKNDRVLSSNNWLPDMVKLMGMGKIPLSLPSGKSVVPMLIYTEPQEVPGMNKKAIGEVAGEPLFLDTTVTPGELLGKSADQIITDEFDGEGYPDDNPKTVLGLAKPSMSAVPPAGLLHCGRAMSDGRRKYGLMNYREKNVSSTIYYDAAMRHLMAWLDGEDAAEDSGVHHLGHVMACCAIILDAEAQGSLNDDRPVPGAFPTLVKEFTAPMQPEVQ